MNFMTDTIENKVLTKIKKAKRGALFFSDNFTSFGNTETIRRTLNRLVEMGKIDRVASGIFVRPQMDKIIGKITPRIEDIAHAIARRDKAKIVPTGVYALNRLGLSTQVPMKIVYLTDGSARKIKIGNYTISFIRTSPKNVAAIGKISRLAIQALKSIGKENISKKELEQIHNVLLKEKISYLEHDLRVAPAWIKEIIRHSLEKLKNNEE
jgi:predicted transcriptional regulator of viral defense system